MNPEAAMSRRRGRRIPVQIYSVAEKMKAEGQCRLCWRKDRGSGGRELTKHRLVPGRHGGEYIVANVIPLCRRCHDEVEREDPLSRRMLRPKLWPMEVAHGKKKLGEEIFELMYPKPAAMSLRMRQVEALLILERGLQGNSPQKKEKKPRPTAQYGWEWIMSHPEQWATWGLTPSEEDMARRYLGMKTATIKAA